MRAFQLTARASRRTPRAARVRARATRSRRCACPGRTSDIHASARLADKRWRSCSQNASPRDGCQPASAAAVARKPDLVFGLRGGEIGRRSEMRHQPFHPHRPAPRHCGQNASAGRGVPRRSMPVSILRCTSSRSAPLRIPETTASRPSEWITGVRRNSRTALRSHGITPAMTRMRQSMPAARSAIPSSTELTASQAASLGAQDSRDFYRAMAIGVSLDYPDDAARRAHGVAHGAVVGGDARSGHFDETAAYS